MPSRHAFLQHTAKHYRCRVDNCGDDVQARVCLGGGEGWGGPRGGRLFKRALRGQVPARVESG